MRIISTNHLTKYYGRARGIVNLDLSVEQGDFFGFIGPNGAGKSTTIRILLGLIRATAGNASIFGMDIVSERKKILENIGYIPSETMFYHGTTVAETLRLSADLRKKDCAQEAGILCERLQLDPHQKTESLSLGNRKKVSIVCALQHRPDLCIFDEPTSGLDPLIQKEFFQILRERNTQGTTIFLSSHILSEVQKYCSRAAVIREGQIAACGGIAELTAANARRVTLTGTPKGALEQLLRQIRQAVPPQPLPRNAKSSSTPEIPTVNVRDLRSGDDTVSFLFQGNIKELMDALTPVPYTDLTITEPDLSEIFMHFYE